MQFGIKHFWSKTPKLMQRLGNLLFLGATTGAAMQIDKSPMIATILFIMGVSGKVISNLFADEPKPIEPKPTDHDNEQAQPV